MITNEVFGVCYVYGQIVKEARNVLEWAEWKPRIDSIKVRVGSNPDLTSAIPSQLLYRWFKECTLSEMSYTDWRNGQCIVAFTPEQLCYSNQALAESLSRTVQIDIEVTFSEPLPYSTARTKAAPTDYFKNTATKDTFTTPAFRAHLVWEMANHSMVLPASGENFISKNLRQFTGGASGLSYTELNKGGRGGLPPPGARGSGVPGGRAIPPPVQVQPALPGAYAQPVPGHSWS